MMKRLSELCTEEKGTVIRIRGRSNVHRMLLRMGLVVGSFIHLSDPDLPDNYVAIHANNGRHLIHKEVADNICIELA